MIRAQSSAAVKSGSLYPTLKRLSKSGWVTV
jgi:DNA-binding PadR family transcriptional regulator